MKSFDEFCVENCKIVLIEEYPCQSRKQLEKRDGEYIGNDKSRLNRCIAGRTRTEYYDATGEHHHLQIELENCSNRMLLLRKTKFEKNNCNPRLALQKIDDVEWDACPIFFPCLVGFQGLMSPFRFPSLASCPEI